MIQTLPPTEQTITRETQGIQVSNQSDETCLSTVFGRETRIRQAVESLLPDSLKQCLSDPTVWAVVKQSLSDPTAWADVKRTLPGERGLISRFNISLACGSALAVVTANTLGLSGVVPYSIAFPLIHFDSIGVKIVRDTSGFRIDYSELSQSQAWDQLPSNSVEQENRANTAISTGNDLPDPSIATLSSDDERVLLLKILTGFNTLSYGYAVVRGTLGISFVPAVVISSLAASGIAHDILSDIIIHDESGDRLNKPKLERLYNLLKQSFVGEKGQKRADAIIADNPADHQTIVASSVNESFEQKHHKDTNVQVIMKSTIAECENDPYIDSDKQQLEQEDSDDDLVHVEEPLQCSTEEGFEVISYTSINSGNDGLRPRKNSTVVKSLKN